MARNLGETTVTIPVLDRLIDLEPGNQTENPPSRSQSERLLKRAVRRDLEWLLNTRRISDPARRRLEGSESLRLCVRAARSLLPDHGHLRRPQQAGAADSWRPSISSSRGWPMFAWRGWKPPTQPRAKCACASRPCCAWTRRRNLSPSIPCIELKSGNCRLSGGDDAR